MMNQNIFPSILKKGDRVRFISPASTPVKEDVEKYIQMIESWGLSADIGPNAFNKYGYFAGTDEERLEDFNDALRNPDIKAIFSTRGGKGAYRIAHNLDFKALIQNPKFLIGFSETTILHLSLLKNCRIIGVHGPLSFEEESEASLKSALMTNQQINIMSAPKESTSFLTTKGKAIGPLIGGNLDMLTTSAGWALPDLRGCILFIEAVGMGLGQVDRQLTMLRRAGHFNGIKAIAVGQFTNFDQAGGWRVEDVLKKHFDELDIPILGGLPLGHGEKPMTIFIGANASLDAKEETLSIFRN